MNHSITYLFPNPKIPCVCEDQEMLHILKTFTTECAKEAKFSIQVLANAHDDMNRLFQIENELIGMSKTRVILLETPFYIFDFIPASFIDIFFFFLKNAPENESNRKFIKREVRLKTIPFVRH